MLCILKPCIQPLLNIHAQFYGQSGEGPWRVPCISRKVEGPRAVNLDDGTVLTLADLPPSDTRRWVASRKAVVVQAVRAGLISRKAALERYELSDEEFDLWAKAVETHGVEALKVTALQKYRQPLGRVWSL